MKRIIKDGVKKRGRKQKINVRILLKKDSFFYQK
jgi:hypothetical protein